MALNSLQNEDQLKEYDDHMYVDVEVFLEWKTHPHTSITTTEVPLVMILIQVLFLLP